MRPGCCRYQSLTWPAVHRSEDSIIQTSLNSQYFASTHHTLPSDMEIYMKNIPASTKNTKLKLELANILHAPPFREHAETLFNFNIFVFKQRKRGPWRAGALTLPSENIGSLFLRLYGGQYPLQSLLIDTTRVQFQMSNRPIRQDVLEHILRTPFQDPREVHAREEMEAELNAQQVRISTIQFGCECRDQVYSVEWEKRAPAHLGFNGERREFRICVDQGDLLSDIRIISIRVNTVYHVSATVDDRSGRPVVFFSLTHPPAFESESTLSILASVLRDSNKPTRHRWSSFDSDDEEHVLITPYISLAIRLECESIEDLRVFRTFIGAAHLRVDDNAYPVVRRGLFSPATRMEYHLWITTLPWIVAFQIEALLRSWLLNMAEALSLRSDVDRVLKTRGIAYTAALLRDFASHAKTLYWYGSTQPGAESAFETQLEVAWSDPVTRLFALVEAAFIYKPVDLSASMDPSAPFQCLHVTITPVTMILEGPFPERSNRVMRTYVRNQECFIRVSFQDENRLQFRFDRDVDGRSFINRRVRGVLRDGITIAGSHFRFLAYSQSALKEHAVWFVKPFRHRDDQGIEHFVDATTIIKNLGNFRVSFDPDLIRCPARYAARISQAFTATDASISVSVEQLMTGPDIKDSAGRYCFTDGVGTISPELAKDIWRALRGQGRRARRDRTYPRAYQVRFQGSKGMLSVDYTLPGRTIVIRPSMIKFEAPESLEIEIARAFDKPGPYFLNRPLIMLLEDLGVSYETFKHLQDDAVHDAQESVTSFERSARLLEAHGLGVSFRLTSSMLGLHKLGMGPLDGDVFWRQMMDFAINHVLRELKHHARIPVPGTDSWTLVGVADIHRQLREGEVFACIDSPNESSLIYLEGPILISRSPTIHPGDVQVVHAIGRPPAGTPLAKESLRNTVVFSIQGERPLPSCLGGGDLDGDLYNVTTRRDLLPRRTYKPASYDPARKMLVDRESTMDDVADFVAEYISGDTLGIIAITWLIIADQSRDGILDPDCMKLAALHSDAVDYPKSGRPVPVNQIPKLKFKAKPDWNVPETIKASNVDYYQSTRAIGKLSQSIDLPALHIVQRVGRSQHRRIQKENQHGQHADILEQFYDETLEDDVGIVVQRRIAEFIDPDEFDDGSICQIWELYTSYASQLRAICADHTLEHKRKAMLTEEEAVVGTIVAKCSQPRKRKDLMSQMREQTAALVSGVKGEITGDDNDPVETSLQRAWIAYRLASMEGDAFGARSFAWIALGSIFDAIKEIEEEERTVPRG